MPRNRFVLPEVVRIDISDGDWIEVKRRLTYGEEQQLNGASLTAVHWGPDQLPGHSEIGLDLKRHAIMRIWMWVSDWSFRDGRGLPVDVNMPNIEALDPDTAREITEALDAHVRETELGKSEPGNQTIIDVTDAGNSPSANTWDGQSPTSIVPTPLMSNSS